MKKANLPRATCIPAKDVTSDEWVQVSDDVEHAYRWETWSDMIDDLVHEANASDLLCVVVYVYTGPGKYSFSLPEFRSSLVVYANGRSTTPSSVGLVT